MYAFHQHFNAGTLLSPAAAADEHFIPTLLALHGQDAETDCQGWLMGAPPTYTPMHASLVPVDSFILKPCCVSYESGPPVQIPSLPPPPGNSAKPPAADVDWSRVDKLSPHPWHYMPSEIADSLLQRLRRPRLPGCGHAAEAAATAGGAFLPAADLAAVAALAAAGAPGAQEGALLAGICRQLGQQQLLHSQRHRPLGSQCRLLARKFQNVTAEAALAAVAPCDSSTLILNSGACPGETPGRAAWRRRWQHAAPLVLLVTGSLLLSLLVALLLGAVGVPADGKGGRGAGGSGAPGKGT